MPITINGSGTVTGISAGGLPDGCIVTADIADNNVTTAKIDNISVTEIKIADNNVTTTKIADGAVTDAKLSGTTCKAWVNFNGTGTVAIRASFNVSSITDTGTGSYTVTFSTAMPDANYSAVAATQAPTSNTGFPMVGNFNNGGTITKTAYTSSSISVLCFGGGFQDPEYFSVVVFR